MLAALVPETPLTRLSDLFIKGREIWSFIQEALVGNLHENFMLFACRSPAWQRVPFPAGLPFPLLQEMAPLCFNKHFNRNITCNRVFFGGGIFVVVVFIFFNFCLFCFAKQTLLKKTQSWTLGTWEAFLQLWPCWNAVSFLWSHSRLKKLLLKTLEMQESSFPVLEQRSGPSWASRSLVSGHENKFEFNLQSLASDPQMGFAEGLLTLAFYLTLSCLLD